MTFPNLMKEVDLSNQVLKYMILHHFDLILIIRLFNSSLLELDLWRNFVDKNIQLKIDQVNQSNIDSILEFFIKNRTLLDGQTHNSLLYVIRNDLENLLSPNLVSYLLKLNLCDLELWQKIEKIF